MTVKEMQLLQFACFKEMKMNLKKAGETIKPKSSNKVQVSL